VPRSNFESSCWTSEESANMTVRASHAEYRWRRSANQRAIAMDISAGTQKGPTGSENRDGRAVMCHGAPRPDHVRSQITSEAGSATDSSEGKHNTAEALTTRQGITMNARPAATDNRSYFFASGGKCLNIFCTPLSRFLVFLSALSESVSLDEPRQIKVLVLASDRSMTREPTL